MCVCVCVFTPPSIAGLLVSLYPALPVSPQDVEHIQAFRHMWVLAAECTLFVVFMFMIVFGLFVCGVWLCVVVCGCVCDVCVMCVFVFVFAVVFVDVFVFLARFVC